MSATALRPVGTLEPMLAEDEMVWLFNSGIVLGVPLDSRPETVERALAALEWIVHQGKRPD
jgi:hypothetical protein